jgi:hypothetical protein
MCDPELIAQGYDPGRAWRGGPLLPPQPWCSTLSAAIDGERDERTPKAWTRNPELRENPAWASYEANRTRLGHLATNATHGLLRAIRQGCDDRAFCYARKAVRLRLQLETMKANKPRHWISKARRVA